MGNERTYREKCLSFASQEVMREQQSWETLVTALSDKIDLLKPILTEKRLVASFQTLRSCGTRSTSTITLLHPGQHWGATVNCT